MLPDDMIAEIERCWSDVPYPGDNDLTVHPLGLDEAFYKGLIGKSWNALTQSFLDYHADCVGLLTPIGFQYFLPAFLIADLRRSEATPIEAWLLPALEGCLGGHSAIKQVSGPEWFISRMQVLTENQRKCLVAYVQLKDFDPETNTSTKEYEAVITHIRNVTTE